MKFFSLGKKIIACLFLIGLMVGFDSKIIAMEEIEEASEEASKEGAAETAAKTAEEAHVTKAPSVFTKPSFTRWKTEMSAELDKGLKMWTKLLVGAKKGISELFDDIANDAKSSTIGKDIKSAFAKSPADVKKQLPILKSHLTEVADARVKVQLDENVEKAVSAYKQLEKAHPDQVPDLSNDNSQLAVALKDPVAFAERVKTNQSTLTRALVKVKSSLPSMNGIITWIKAHPKVTAAIVAIPIIGGIFIGITAGTKHSSSSKSSTTTTTPVTGRATSN